MVVCDSPLPGFYCPGLALVFEAEGKTAASSDVVQDTSGQLFTGSGFVVLAADDPVTIANISVPFSGEYDIFLRHSLPGLESRIKIEIKISAPPILPNEPPLCTPLLEAVDLEAPLTPDSLTELPLSACLLVGNSYSLTIVLLEGGTALLDSVVATPSLREEATRQLEVFSNEEELQRYRDEGCVLDHVRVAGALSPDSAFCERVTCSATYQLFNGSLGMLSN